MKDYYVVLGVSRGEDERAIREAYRQLALRHHPDRAGPEGTTAFREIAEAYRVLSDRERRAHHDRSLKRLEGRLDVESNTIVLDADRPPEPLAPEPVSILGGFEHVRPSPEAVLDRVLHNLFAGRASKGERLATLDVELVLSGSEAARGGVVRLGVPAFRRCPACGGTGGDWLYPCATCDDRGVVDVEAPVQVHLPQRVRDGAVLEVPLDAVGIRNLLVRLRLRVDPGL
jgi:DnaJ-class molecular chaperone